MVRLRTNTGPAGGFRAGLVEAFADPATDWAYLCEDDVGLFDLPAAPRLAGLLDRIGDLGDREPRRGCGGGLRSQFRRSRRPHREHRAAGRAAGRSHPVDVACWGATLVTRAVVDAGVLPDPDWFFGLEDFDFFCRVRQAGFEVLVDGVAARPVAGQQTIEGREAALTASAADRRATRPWRAYYHARNSFALARRHGRPSWYAWHLAYSVRHLQKAAQPAQRSAIAHGLWDGARGRMGQNPTLCPPGGRVRPVSRPGGSHDALDDPPVGRPVE